MFTLLYQYILGMAGLSSKVRCRPEEAIVLTRSIVGSNPTPAASFFHILNFEVLN